MTQAVPTLSPLDASRTAGCIISVHPVLGRAGVGVLGRQPQSFATRLQAMAGLWGHQGTGMSPGAGPCPARGLGIMTRWCLPGRILPAEQLPCPIPSLVVLWQQAEQARGSRETGIARGQCSSPSFLLQTCAKACWGRRRVEEALAGFQLRLGSLAVLQYLCLTRGPGPAAHGWAGVSPEK